MFTLGSPAGWGVKGVMMGDPVSNVYNLFGNTGSASCIGYDALTIRIGPSDDVVLHDRRHDLRLRAHRPDRVALPVASAASSAMHAAASANARSRP